MTSRRSRLKAVANLPVRRKPPAPQGSVADTALDENVTADKIIPSSPRNDEINRANQSTCQNYEPDKSVNNRDTHAQDNKSGIQPHVVTHSISVFHSHENSTLQKVETQDFNTSEVFENNNGLNRSCKLSSSKSGYSSNSPLTKENKFFKTNIGSSPKQEKGHCKESEIFEGSQSVGKLSHGNAANNVINNKNNNIVEDGVKCYAVLTSQSATDVPSSNYTITPLTPCVNTSISENDIYPINQEFDEVQIYTEVVEPTEISVTNEINGNNRSLIESGTALINCNIPNQVEVISVNINHTQPSLSQSMCLKPSPKNGTLNAKLSVGLGEEFLGNPVTVRDRPTLENSVTPLSQNVPPEFSSPFKQSISTIRRKRSKCNDFTKKLADARREFQKKYEKTKPDRSTLKMIDLIFYNPTTNPMESKTKFERKDQALPQGDLIHEMLTEEKVDEPEALDGESGILSCDNTENDSLSKMPVPQVKIGLNGEIIIDEKSLIIETTEAKKGREDLQNSIPIFEDRGSKVSYYRGKTRKTRDWTDFETKRFYKALNTIGPDFTLMQKYFPKRSRLELKNKFKREERLNRSLIDRALNNPSEFDMTQLEEDLAVEKKAEEEEVEMRLCRAVKQATRRPRIRSSFLSREMIESDGETENTELKSENGHSKKMLENEKNKRRRENNFIFQKFLMKESEVEMSENSSSPLGVYSRVDHGVT